MAGPNTWTDETLDLLRRLWAEGVTASVIAKAVGRTRNAVLGQAKRSDLPKRRDPTKPNPDWYGKARELRAQGMKFSDIAQIVGRHPSKVSAACRGVECPIDHRRAAGIATLARAVAALREKRPRNYRRASQEELERRRQLHNERVRQYKAKNRPLLAKPRLTKEQIAELRRNRKPETAQEAKLRQIRELQARDRTTRPPASITLPKLRFMD